MAWINKKSDWMFRDRFQSEEGTYSSHSHEIFLRGNCTAIL